MKIVIATPLFPPDIEEPAPYVKTLAAKLTPTHSVTVVAYGHLHERVEGVRFVTIDKRAGRGLRVLQYVRGLWAATRAADILYVENGPSVELPALLVSVILRTPLIFHLGDARAHERAQKELFRGLVERMVSARARVTRAESPLPRPEILPFEPYPAAALAAYTASWDKHLEQLTQDIAHE